MSETELSTESRTEEQFIPVFRKTSDNFVNEGVAEIARIFREVVPSGDIKVTETHVYLSKNKVEEAFDYLSSVLFDTHGSMITNTHRRTSAANDVKEQLEETLDDNEVTNLIPSSPDTSFPSASSGFPNDVLDSETLEGIGLDLDELDWVDDGRNVFSLSPSYVGNPQEDAFKRTENSAQDFLESMKEVSEKYAEGGDFEFSHCDCCGRTDYPSNDFELSDGNEVEIEYNQGFSLLVTKSSEKPLGQKGSLNTKFSGRCVSCLLAGWVYIIMQKAVVPLDVSGSEYRVFGFGGDLNTLTSVREGLVDNLLMDLNKSPYTSIPRPNTRARKLESLLVLGRLRRVLQERVEESGEDDFFERGSVWETLDVDSMFSFVTTPRKSGQPVRGIRSIKSVEVSEGVKELLKRQKTEDGEVYWPVRDILSLYAGMNNGDEEVGVQSKNRFASGLLSQDIRLVSEGLFELYKLYAGSDSIIVRIKGSYIEHYVTKVTEKMSDNLSQEELSDLKQVGKYVGEVFSSYSDIGTLSSLKNASSSEKFVRKFETAMEDAMKKGHKSDERQFVPNNDVIGEVIEILLDEEKFDTAKRVLMIHATTAAQYKTMVSRSKEDE